MAEPALALKDVTKRFGRQTALDGLSMTVPSKSIAAFVGANGAGKTTTFSLIGTFFRPDSGSIFVGGLPLAAYRRGGGIIGILPQDVLFFENRSLERHLLMFSRLAGFPPKAARVEAARVLELTDLSDRANALPSELSHGMKVRFGVAQSLVGSPKLILLDEPTAGLDPKMVASFRSIIENLKGTTTLIISSHDLGQLELMCDYLCIIDHGKLIRQGGMGQLLFKSSQIVYHLGAALPALSLFNTADPEYLFELRAPEVLTVQFNPEKHRVADVNALVLSILLKNDVPILEVESKRTLEEAYLAETDRQRLL